MLEQVSVTATTLTVTAKTQTGARVLLRFILGFRPKP